MMELVVSPKQAATGGNSQRYHDKPHKVSCKQQMHLTYREILKS